MPYALRCFLVVGGLCVEDVRHKGLRVAVIQRKEARLHLHHDAVSGLEDMVHRWQAEAIEQGFVWSDGFGMLEAGAVAATEDVERDGQLIAAHCRLGWVCSP